MKVNVYKIFVENVSLINMVTLILLEMLKENLIYLLTIY